MKDLHEDDVTENLRFIESLGLKNMALVQPEWVEAASWTASLKDQIKSYDKEVRLMTFGEGDPNFSDQVDPLVVS